jgi:Uma2 family endonuclease
LEATVERPVPEAISLSDFLAWEGQQAERFEWIDGTVVHLDGVSDDHAAINANLTRLIREKLDAGPCFVRGSDRELVPFDENDIALGSFYGDLFVSCSAEDRKGAAAHFPCVVIEILSDHVGGEFTKKRDAYMRSAKIVEYIIIDSTRQYAVRYWWTADRRLAAQDFYRGPLPLSSLDMNITFSQIYAGTSVPFVVHPVHDDSQTMSGD